MSGFRRSEVSDRITSRAPLEKGPHLCRNERYNENKIVWRINYLTAFSDRGDDLSPDPDPDLDEAGVTTATSFVALINWVLAAWGLGILCRLGKAATRSVALTYCGGIVSWFDLCFLQIVGGN